MSDLPQGWEWATLGEILQRIETGKSFSGQGRPALPNEWGVIKVSAMTYGVFRAEQNKAVCTGAAFSRAAEIKPGDLLVSRANTRDYVGASVLVGDCRPRLLLSDKSLRLIPAGKIDHRWLWYALSSPKVREYISNTSPGVKEGMRNISQDSLRSTPLALPPLAEQRRIVAALDDHLSRLDAGRRSLDVARSRLTRLNAAVRANEIGTAAAPDGRLADVLDSIEAGRSFGGSARPASDDEWGIIKVSSMTWGEFRPSENKAVADDSRIEVRFEIKPGDVLVSRANTVDYVGAAVLVHSTRPKLLLSDKSLRLKPKPAVDPRWLVEILSSPHARQQIADKSTGNQESMRNISQAALLSVRIPLHDADQQSKLAEGLADHRAAIGRLDADLAKARTAASGLRRSLLAEAFVGHLVPQDPNDEPASVLLDRIRAERAAQPKPRHARRPVAL